MLTALTDVAYRARFACWEMHLLSHDNRGKFINEYNIKITSLHQEDNVRSLLLMT